MAGSTKLIKHRIKSVQNTRKITKAMELVSASKMRKAVNSVLGTRPYSDLSWQMVNSIGENLDVNLHPLLRKSDKENNILTILIASDRGLAGSYNAQVLRLLSEVLKNPNYSFVSTKNIDYVSVGKKAQGFLRKLGVNIVAAFTNLSNNPGSLDLRPIAGLAIGEFIAKKYDAVYLIYTDFYSAIKQVPRIKKLLPIEKDENLGATGSSLRGGLNDRGNLPDKIATSRHGGTRNDRNADEYIFEPNQKQVLDMVLPRIVETQVYQAVLEANASEHSSRMVAMKNATEAAGEMVDDLVFTFNQLRQATITRELAEIAAAKIAIE